MTDVEMLYLGKCTMTVEYCRAIDCGTSYISLLVILSLDHNLLNGTIPTELGLMAGMKDMMLRKHTTYLQIA